MTLMALDQIRLDRKSHASALGWIGLLYRSPKRVEEAEKALSRGQKAMAVLQIYLHVLPFLGLLCILGRWIEFGILDLKTVSESSEDYWAHAFFLALGLALGLAPGP